MVKYLNSAFEYSRPLGRTAPYKGPMTITVYMLIEIDRLRYLSNFAIKVLT